MSLPALAFPLPDICPRCIEPENRGLCANDVCRRAVLPREPRNPLVRLIGDALVEQTKQQEPEPKERVQIDRISRRNARKVARSQRRGYFGLAKAIAAAK